MSKTYIIDTLRAHLKARDLTYKDLADGLDLSEVSIKRLFTGADIGLDRLEQICQFLQIELSDLFKTSPKKRKLISSLTQAQEAEFAKNNKLLMVAVCALNFWSVQDMWTHLTLTRGQIQSLMQRLDEIGFLDLQSARQYKLLVSHNFAWITGGPIMQMVQGMSQEYFADSFEGDTQVLRILNVRVSTPAQAQLKTRLEQIAQEYVDQSRADSHLPLHERPPVSVCVAARAWIPKFMHELIRMETLQSGGAPLLNMPPEGRSAEGDSALQTAQKAAVKTRKATAKTSPKPAAKTPAKRAAKGKVSKSGVKYTSI
jgi:DNA-binding Xre family transcriptional regulator